MKKLLSLLFVLLLCVFIFAGCTTENNTKKDIENTFDIADQMTKNQATPTDVDYSLERYNLIRRAYWVNGQREKAINYPCQITKPLGYIILITEGGSILGRFVVDGKVNSLNSWLTPDYYYTYLNLY